MICACCCLLLMVSWTAFGQDPEPLPIPGDYPGKGKISEVTSEIPDLKDELNIIDLNRITIQQIGDMNDAFIHQVSSANPNLVKVYQEGDENFSDLTQTGSNNATGITQYGDGNIFSGIHEGNYITNTVIQEGNGNIISQDLKASLLDIQIEQFGNGHELNQTETTRDGIGYKVTQSGDVGMKIIIKQGDINK